MKKLIIAITFLVSSFAYAQVAEWNEPIQIAVDSGHVRPDFHIDKLGRFHIIWEHLVKKFPRKVQDIYYKKSIDLGKTWSIAKDISLNEEDLQYANPQICTDSENNIHIAFGEHRGDYAQRVLYTSCNAQGEWQQKIDTIAEKNPSEYIFPGWPLIAADAQDNILLTWGLQYPINKIHYRKKDKATGEWGDMSYPFVERASFLDLEVKEDTIYAVGAWLGNNVSTANAFYATYSHDDWSAPHLLSEHDDSGSHEITSDKKGNLFAIHNECNINLDDSLFIDKTFYCDDIYNSYQEVYNIIPKLTFPADKDIVFDQYNRVHIVQSEPFRENGISKLIHYRRLPNGWVGEQLDISYNNTPFTWINLQVYEDDICLVYVDWEKVYDTWEAHILMRKYTPQPEGIADNAEVSALGTFKVYPNPVQGVCHLDYQLANTAQVDIAVYDMQGRQVSTIYQGQQAAGAHQLSWDGSSLNPGVYIVRLQVGKYVVNRKITVK